MEEKTRNISRRSFITGALGTAAVLSCAGGTLIGCSPNTDEESADSTDSANGQSGVPGTGTEGTWIPTTCNMCFNGCAILVRVVDGVAVEIKGNPNSTIGGGRICAKGASGLMQLYDPYRITKPLVRTNPKKGLDQDPGWEEISWEEAMDLFLEKTAVGREYPGALALSNMITSIGGLFPVRLFLSALGMEYEAVGSDICGAGTHAGADLYVGANNSMPDYQYCNYLLQFGTQAGTATRHGFNMTAKMFADRRAEGCKLVDFDPHMSAAGDKADEWIPLIPGTDAVVALAISNVLVNELGIYDAEFLKQRSNAPSLVDVETGRVIRAADTNKALYWDEDTQSALPWDEATSPVLEGSFEVDGKTVRPAWELYKEHMLTYTPEYAEEISTVPADTLRRIAKEFGEAAHIGETIEIDGYTLPYRPVAADCFSGVARHKHSMLTNWSIAQLNAIVGACQSVGGFIGFGPKCHGYSDTSPISWEPDIWEEDGLINHTAAVYPIGGTVSYYDAIRNNIQVPTGRGMMELQPYALDPHFFWMNQNDPSLYNNLFQKTKVLFSFANNPLKWWGDFDEQAKILEEYEYVITNNLYLSDASYYTDLFIPEASYLERYDILDNQFLAHRHLGGLNMDWNYCLRQPVVEARDGALGVLSLCCEMAYRAGAETNEAFVNILNGFYAIDPAYALPPDEKVDPERLIDAVFKTFINEEHGIDWFKENGSYLYPRKVDEVYIWANGDPGRVPIYQDMHFEAKEKIEAVVEELGIYWETDDWQPLPDWKPCHDYEITDPEYDIMPIYWTNQVNTDTWQVHNAYLNELNEQNPYGYTVEINAAVAAEKGIADGDAIVITSKEGKTVEAIAVTSEAVHPQCIAVIGGNWNSRSEYLPIGKGKGVGIVDLIPSLDPKRYDHLCSGFDQCIRVKVEKA